MIIINRAAALADILLKALYVTNRRSDQCVTYLLLLLHVAYTHKSKFIHMRSAKRRIEGKVWKENSESAKNIVCEEKKETKRGKKKQKLCDRNTCANQVQKSDKKE